MKIFRNPQTELPDTKGAWAALGNFDGVHLGHRQVIGLAMKRAAESRTIAGVVTFYPHPLSIIDARRTPAQLCTLEQRLELLEHVGAQFVVIYTFDSVFALQEPLEFVRDKLVKGLGLKGVVTGRDFLFGRGRTGDVGVLGELASNFGMSSAVADDVIIDGLRVSSSRIRHILKEGRVDAAAHLLGRPYFIDGKVVAGDGRGKTLGFPTVNLELSQDLMLRDGIYAGAARVDGRFFPAACHLGPIPTFGKSNRSLEVHLIGLNRDLYGHWIRVWFVQRLRDVERFLSVEHLISALHRDVDRTKLIFQSMELTRLVP